MVYVVKSVFRYFFIHFEYNSKITYFLYVYFARFKVKTPIRITDGLIWTRSLMRYEGDCFFFKPTDFHLTVFFSENRATAGLKQLFWSRARSNFKLLLKINPKSISNQMSGVQNNIWSTGEPAQLTRRSAIAKTKPSKEFCSNLISRSQSRVPNDYYKSQDCW